MRQAFSLLALPAICFAAEQQQPLDFIKGWFNKAASYIPASVPNVPNPVAEAAAKVAGVAVTPLTMNNWKSNLLAGAPTKTGEPDEWLVYINGGNTTCGPGMCDNTTLAWNASVAILAAHPYPPKLGSVDCDNEGLLCALWSVRPPAIYHMVFPLGDSSHPAVRYIQLNTTNTTATSIAELHSKRKFEAVEPYTGIWQPFNGLLATTGLNIPLAYVIWAFAKMPSWLPMVLISFISRSFMGRRMPQQRPRQAGAAPGAAPAPQS